MNTNARKSLTMPATDDHSEAPGDLEIQGPAIITKLHVQDRETSTVAGAPRAWRKLSQLENAYQLERLGPKDSGGARDRREAGQIFSGLWDTSQAAGKDSTLALDGAGGTAGIPLSEAQTDAIQRLVQIEMHLGMRDRTIIRAVCAYGHSPKEAMHQARMPMDTRVTARFCEALDALIDAIERTAKRGRR